MKQQSPYTPTRYSLGLDIGTTSVGWAVIDIDKQRIHDLGVRIFERPEDPQNGDSLAKPRRDARSARRRLRRRRQRLNQLKHFFAIHNLLSREQIEAVLHANSPHNALDVYTLRRDALARPLNAEELLKVLYHIAKHRGFKSNRKVEEEGDKEGGRVTQSLSANQQFLRDHNYQTVGVALASDEKYKSHKRNRRDDYSNSFARTDFLHELEAVVAAQRPHALRGVPESALHELIYGLDSDGRVVNTSALMYQRPFMTKELIERMVGTCTFEPDEPRAPKASYSFELFRLASDLTHLVYIPKGTSKREAQRTASQITLNAAQIERIVQEARRTRSLTYGKVRTITGISDDYTPDYIRGKISKDDPSGEKNKFGELTAYHDIKAALKHLPDDWQIVDNESTLNRLAYILTTEKADEAIKESLQPLPISDDAKTALLRMKPSHFKTFGHLSIKALQKITPHTIAGKRYNEACERAGYNFQASVASLEQITNPVVKRAITQTTKVVRAIERKYGKPYYIKIETARDLAKNFKDRKAIERENKENQVKNQHIIQQLEEQGITTPTGQQIIKVKLYREQNGVCLYSGKEINFATMLRDDNAYQIDHIVPFSRSNNDGLTNKVLVLTEENQQKANRTPFEYFGQDDERWQAFVKRVESTYQVRDIKTNDKATNHDNYKFNGYARRKTQNLLIEAYKNDIWNVRALNDTRYITKFIMNYLQQTVDFADGEDKQRVFAPTGTITAYLRKRWGLSKVREEDVLHHAADAAIVAAISPSVIYQANLFAKSRELHQYLANAHTIDEKEAILREATDEETGEVKDDELFSTTQREKARAEYLKQSIDEHTKDRFPEPWQDFRKEVLKRTLNVPMDTLQNELRGIASYDDEFRLSVKPVFVSRMPRRKATGQAHKETIRSPKVKDSDQRTVRMPLTKVKRKDVEHSVLKESDAWLYAELLHRLDTHDNNPEKAFAEPVYKHNKRRDKHGNPLSPVSTIKVYSTQPSGFYLNDGKAFVNNGSIVRLDVYQKPNKKGKIEHFFVPVYTHQIGNNRPVPTKILPEPKGFTDIDNTFTKVCSLYPNDYVRIFLKNSVEEGYYTAYDSASGRITIINHSTATKEGESRQRVSARSATLIERLDISVLGDNYRWL